jgi:MFS family permease
MTPDTDAQPGEVSPADGPGPRNYTSYTLTLASLILLAGSLSDRWGRRRVFLAGLSWFILASVLCAAAPGIG